MRRAPCVVAADTRSPAFAMHRSSNLGVNSYGEQSLDEWITRERPKADRIACPWLIRNDKPPPGSRNQADQQCGEDAEQYGAFEERDTVDTAYVSQHHHQAWIPQRRPSTSRCTPRRESALYLPTWRGPAGVGGLMVIDGVTTLWWSWRSMLSGSVWTVAVVNRGTAWARRCSAS